MEAPAGRGGQHSTRIVPALPWNRRVMLLQLILFNLYLDPDGVLDELYRFGSHRSRICRSRDKLAVFDQQKK